MAHSVSVWESDPKAFKYNAVGYLQISPEVMHKTLRVFMNNKKLLATNLNF